jgi:copper transport protein
VPFPRTLVTRAAVLAWLAVTVACLLAMAARPQSAYAHAELLDWRVTQTTNGGMTSKGLVLKFGEKLDPAFAHVQIFDRGSRAVIGTTLTVDPRTLDRIGVNLPAGLADGTYRASWWVRAADGDTSQNSFYFNTSGSLDPLAMLPPPDVRDPATSPPSSLLGTSVTALLRWAGLVAILFVVGGTFFMMFLWRPITTGARFAGVDRSLVHALRVVCFEAAAVLVFASVLLLLLQAETARLPLLQPAGATPPLLISPTRYANQIPAQAVSEVLASSYGHVWIARCALAALIGILGLTLPLDVRRRRSHWWALLAVGAATLVTFSLTAHGAVTPRTRLAVAVDWTHLVAASVWFGALPALIETTRLLKQARFYLPPSTAEGGLGNRLVGRFSVVALPTMAWLAASGFYAFAVNVGSPALLLRTTYGVTLTVKLCLVATLVVIGSINRFLLLPRIRAKESGGSGWGIARTLPIELGIGLGVVICAGLLLSLATAKDAWTAREQLGYFARAQQGGVVMTLRTVDSSKGGGAIAVDVADHRPGTGASPALVTARLGTQQLPLTSIPVAVPGVQRFGAAGAGTALGTADSVTIEYRLGGLPAVTSTFHLPASKIAAPTAPP